MGFKCKGKYVNGKKAPVLVDFSCIKYFLEHGGIVCLKLHHVAKYHFTSGLSRPLLFQETGI